MAYFYGRIIFSESLHLSNDLFGRVPQSTPIRRAEPTSSSKILVNHSVANGQHLVNSLTSKWQLDIRCPQLTVNIRIPIADCSPAASRPAYYERRVHREFIRLTLDNGRILLEESGSLNGFRAQLTSRAFHARLVGIETQDEGNTNFDDHVFLYANSTTSPNCKISLEMRNLQSNQLFETTFINAQTPPPFNAEGNNNAQMWQSYFQQSPVKNFNGQQNPSNSPGQSPFSAKKRW